MAAITVKLPDGTPLELSDGATGGDAAAAIGPGLAKAALAIKVDGELRDLSAPLPDGAEIAILTDRDPEALALIRHDAAHVLATAVVELWPGTKVSIGPAIDNGFYYDFEFPDDFRPSVDDLPKIEEAMARHIAADEEFERTDVTPDEALERFKAEDQPYKVELIEDLVRDQGVETVSLYRNGPFTDLCLGPARPDDEAHQGGQADLGRRRVLARRREPGDAQPDLRNGVLQAGRPGGARAPPGRGPRARPSPPGPRARALHAPARVARACRSGCPQGTVLLRLIQAEVDAQLEKRGYAEIKTPHIMDVELWHRSGHYDNYRENMYFSDVDDRQFALKPMNCPGACLVFGAERRSYRDLPLRLAEYGHVSRHEREGVLHGLLRVRAFTQDDAHVYCTLDQVQAEVDSICESIDELYSRFGFEDVRVELSTRPEKSIGSDEDWEAAEKALTEALEGQGREYVLNPGDGSFYGPKIDFHVTDALGRSWQLGTCQLDFQMPERFELTYWGEDNSEHRPVMIHRALIGSMERFAGILIEHYAGRFPDWLAPVQVGVLPVADRHNERAAAIVAELTTLGVRARRRRSHRVGGAEDPRRRARKAALHGDPGRP